MGSGLCRECKLYSAVQLFLFFHFLVGVVCNRYELFYFLISVLLEPFWGIF